MKILHVYKTYLPCTIGGIEQTFNLIARGTSVLGVSPEVFSLSSTKAECTVFVDGHPVHRCRANFEIASTPFSIAAFSLFAQLSKSADLIHYHFPYPFADMLHFAARIKKPTVLTYHSDIIKQKFLLRLYNPLKNRFLSSIDHIVATSPNYLATSDDLRIFKDKTSIIPIGLDKNSYPPPTENIMNYWHNRFGKKFFLFIGVLRYYKGLHILIEAAARTDYPVVIVGAGPIERELRNQVARLGSKNVHFVGQIPDEDKIALLQLSYAVVFPSHLRSEAFGISLLEGAMYGKPMISSEIGTGTTYINIHQETGLVIAPNDSSALQRAMTYLWQNPQEAASMGKNAESRYWTLFTADKMAKAYYKIYQDCLNPLSQI